MKKTIVLVMPTVSDLSYLIQDALEHQGFTVINPLELPKPQRRYPSFSAHCYAKYRKIFFNDKETARQLKEQTALYELKRKLEKTEGEVYSLFIRSDLYSVDFIKAIVSSCKNGNISYQFDGLSRYPLIYERIPLFDRFYVFDPKDIKNSEFSLLPSTNFYFDHTINKNLEIEYDFYYVGAHHHSRYHLVTSFAQFIEDEGYTSNLNVFPLDIHDDPRKYYPNSNIKILDNIVPFTNNTQLSQKGRVLLDFVINEHSGLSFRTFEALGYQKKLITTNQDVVHYDFYHPNNIFVWNGKDFDKVKDFLALPYYKIPDNIYKKYSFGNWINYVINKQPNLPFSLPEIASNNALLTPKTKIYLVCFDNPTPIGGIKQIYKMAHLLNKLGYRTSVIHKKAGFQINWFQHSIPVVYYPDLYDLLHISVDKPKRRHLKRYLQYKFAKYFKKSFILPEEDAILMLPEVLGLKMLGLSKYRTIIYNQNNHYTFLDYPYFKKSEQDPYLHENMLGVFTVSEYAHSYLSMAYPSKKIFNTGISLGDNFKLGNTLKQKKIAFMPRKLKQDSQQLFQLLQNSTALKNWEFVAIDNKSENEVVKILQESAFFLSFNHIEGFGLPPVEAMACGCYVIGYAGNAGKEYFLPEFSTLIPDLDVLTFAVELEKLVADYNSNPNIYINKGIIASEFVLSRYNENCTLQAVKEALNELKI